MTVTKSLRLTFLNEKDKKKSLTFTDAKPDLSQEAIKAVMATIAQSNVFADKEGDMYKTPQGAAYIEHTVNAVFEDTVTK